MIINKIEISTSLNLLTIRYKKYSNETPPYLKKIEHS